MNVTNKLISGDSKGLAGMTLEKMMNRGYLVGKGPFVAAFATANHGDTSPNILGSREAIQLITECVIFSDYNKTFRKCLDT